MAEKELRAVVLRLRHSLSSCCKSIEGGEEETSGLLEELASFLDSISEAATSEPENEEARKNAVELLLEIQSFLVSSSTPNQAVVDALSFELPKAVSKFAGVSDRCLEIADSIIDWFVGRCNPRDMISILSEALDSLSTSSDPGYAAPLLTGLSKVFVSIKRHHFKQAKLAVPVVLNVLKVVSVELADRDAERVLLFNIALAMADSICVVSTKLDRGESEELQSLMGLFILQIMVDFNNSGSGFDLQALVSASIPSEQSGCTPLVSEICKLLPRCGLTYLGLITESDVDAKISIVTKDKEDDIMTSFPDMKLGASLSVIWGHISNEIAEQAGENMSALKDKLQHNQVQRWEAIGMLKHIFSSVILPWDIKRHTVEFLLGITNGSFTPNCHNDEPITDCSIYMPSLFATAQAITKVIMHSPDSTLRKNSFEALKRASFFIFELLHSKSTHVLADTPIPERIDILQALITNSDSSSISMMWAIMFHSLSARCYSIQTAILLDLVRGELRKETLPKKSTNEGVDEAGNHGSPTESAWTERILELVELVLRPPHGGQPSFPEHGEAVLAALNLYRFVLMKELAGKTNKTGVLFRKNLLRACNEWLVPLRTIVSSTMADPENDPDEVAGMLNPIELVLYHCIELVEQNLSANPDSP
ncbi:unnamed protein product [Linum tenue]|uniref:Aberrant root formation protein 4 n=1 Tax=Linum tenue TaxID=586396 RepID=A0AAV0K2R4_9ROSI|nr:unnamed protein product [Linum tenue]